MRRIIFSILSIFFLVSPILSQEILSESEMKLKIGLNNRTESIPVINKETEELSLFVLDRKNMYLNKYDKNSQFIESKVFDRPKFREKSIVEVANTSDNEYLFLLSDVFKENLAVLRLDAQLKSIKPIKGNMQLLGFKYLHSFVYNNELHLMIVEKDQSTIHVYKFLPDGSLNKKKYELKNEVFFNKKNEKDNLFNILENNSLGIEYIKNNLPISIGTASGKVKIYIKNDTLFLSLDQNDNYSQIVTLNLSSTDYKLNNFKKLSLDNGKKTTTNSFLFNGNLYQVIANKKQMKYTVTDIHSKKTIKELNLFQNDSIIFKNTPIIIENHGSGIKKTESTEKFFRKISSSNIGVSVYAKNDTIQVTLGGMKETTVGGANMGGLPMPPTNVSTSTYITCLFDKNQAHLDGTISPNIFDRVNDFSKDSVMQKTETIFRFNDYFLFGYYDSGLKKYFLRKFED